MKLSPALNRKALHVDDERSEGNGIIVTLRYGFRFSSDPLAPVHVEGFDTPAEARAGIRAAILCTCADCDRADL